MWGGTRRGKISNLRKEEEKHTVHKKLELQEKQKSFIYFLRGTGSI